MDHLNEMLTISVQAESESEEQQEDKGVKMWSRERSMAYVARSLRMPRNADLSKISAKLENGVLSVLVAKKVKEQPESTRVDIL